MCNDVAKYQACEKGMAPARVQGPLDKNCEVEQHGGADLLLCHIVAIVKPFFKNGDNIQTSISSQRAFIKLPIGEIQLHKSPR